MKEDTLSASRSIRRWGGTARYLIAACAVAAVAACGSTAAPAASSSAPKVSLNITVQGAHGSKAKHWTLQCEPAGGTHPDPAAACRALLAVKKPFAPVPVGTMCPMIIAGAGRAIFNGTWFGTKVHRTIIDGGCDLGRWGKLGQVVN